jgi:dipeptidyl aminopeptidase/acylaminoacyl peptidase
MTELAKFIAVVDGVEHKPYDYILHPVYSRDGSGILFSPAGGRTAYIAGTRNAGTFLVVDGIEGKTYDGISSVTFSADGLHIAYVAQRRDASGWNDFATVLDGIEGKWYRADEVSNLTFSPDGVSLVYIVRQSPGFGSNQFAVVDGEEQPYHHGVSDITFSPDSKHLAYVAVDLQQGVYEYTVILDGVPGKAYWFIGSGIQDSDGGLKFSPDSQRLAYVAVPGHLIRTLVVDGVPGKVYTSVTDVTFSPDSRHIAYIADGVIAVLNNVETTYPAIEGKLILSQDALRSAAIVSDSYNKAVAVDGVAGKSYYWVLAPVFSPDGRHIAYVAGNDKGESFMVVDGIVGTCYNSVSAPVFSPDGQHIAYVAGNSKSMSYFIVVDGIEGGEYDKIMDMDEPDTPSINRASTIAIVFDSDRDFHYLALSEEKLYLVRGSAK